MARSPRIVGVVTGSNRSDPLAREALSRCQVAELRADTFAPPESLDVPALLRGFRAGIARLPRPPEVMLTLRLVRDGGSWPDARAGERLEVWEAVARTSDARPDWVDIEAEEIGTLPASVRDALRAAGIRVLVSHHDFQGASTGPALADRLDRMRAAAPEGLKFALTCRDEAALSDCLALAREVAGLTGAGGVFSMGGPGRATRVLGPLLGCPLTYGYLAGAPVAPGQLSVDELADFFARAADDRDAPDFRGADPRTLLSWADRRLQEAGLAR